MDWPHERLLAITWQQPICPKKENKQMTFVDQCEELLMTWFIVCVCQGFHTLVNSCAQLFTKLTKIKKNNFPLPESPTAL